MRRPHKGYYFQRLLLMILKIPSMLLLRFKFQKFVGLIPIFFLDKMTLCMGFAWKYSAEKDKWDIDKMTNNC